MAAMVDQSLAQITAALEGGDFERAAPLLTEFFSSLEANLSQMTAMPERAAALQEAIGWMHRWLSLAQVMRSHCYEQIRVNLGSLSYSSQASRTCSTVSFTA